MPLATYVRVVSLALVILLSLFARGKAVAPAPAPSPAGPVASDGVIALLLLVHASTLSVGCTLSSATA